MRFLVAVAAAVLQFWPAADALGQSAEKRPVSAEFALSNAQVRFAASVREGKLARESIETVADWASSQGPGARLESDGGFAVEVVWNDWQAPGKANNGDVFCRFGPGDFTFIQEVKSRAGGGEKLVLAFQGPETLRVDVEYALGAKDHWVRRRLRVYDYTYRKAPAGHLLHALHSLDAKVEGPASVLKAGGFGQPVALLLGGGGAFLGLEWPSADNSARPEGGGFRVLCGQEMGEPLTPEGVWGEPVVLAVTPDTRVKEWFTRYLDDIRARPLRPYCLYNSWYDLRNAIYPRVKPESVMDEANVRRVVGLVQEKMVREHGIELDAFVLDDGWDVYESDWALRGGEFPGGLRPIVDELKKTGTRLGIWFGPTGGYSFHDVRTSWFRKNGYEVTDNGMLSVAGPKYAALLEKRTTDFARDGVGYFKWDGYQFVDNNPANGHPIGLYSRRAAMKNLARQARAVRAVDPDMFLNITSGTWLSPWWLKYADAIWMDGEDYGEAEVSSISTRDSSITYRDMVLYEDFHRKGLWFPVSNLMTHGVLKGSIDVQEIGRGEPLSKFADEVAFYLARGVSMYELYISPDVLSDGEWDVLAGNLRWARDRFPVLRRAEMVGGDPSQSQPYGYVHFVGDRGVIAVRNPDIAAGKISVALDPAAGLDPRARDLVVERVYPTRWASPELRAACDVVEIPLGGYEAAIYEIRPLASIPEPVLAGAVFEADGKGALTVLETGTDIRLLNPDKGAVEGGLKSLSVPAPPPVVSAVRSNATPGTLEVEFALDASARDATLGFLLHPDAAHRLKADPRSALELDGRSVTPDTVSQKGVWAWVTVPVSPGTHKARLAVSPGKGEDEWSGSVQVWVAGAQRVQGRAVRLTPVVAPPARPLPRHGRGPSELPKTVRLAESPIAAAR